ncbi:MAG: fluoride efflux transporter CrcB [Woeseia sp.]|nr:fluoride efflux transporter CrcB [Woeseia sp.]MBT8096191.1 fluoride efflux transporter CrcB [Woeseia sp.]NNE60222.1 fluoride efflux transporter CrcB [Woeseia sp.]NNL56072.1 fluoride efflux transporter CrcB [Woeseia sp.]
MSLTALLYVGCGGALGAMSRYAVSIFLARHGAILPLGTLVSNLAGCFIMGALMQWLAEANWLEGTTAANEHYRLLFAVGFCGSFTTLSALVYEMSSLINFNQAMQAAAYLLASVAGGFLCFFAGIYLARAVLPTP